MTEKKRDSFSPPALGGSSLLVVFAVLALTVFALLSLSTVRADVRLGDAAAKAVADYYTADCQAQEILAQLRRGESPADVPVTVSVAHDADRVERSYTYAVPISDTQELQAEVLVGEDGAYTVLRWDAVQVGEWEPDNSLHVWDGEMFG